MTRIRPITALTNTVYANPNFKTLEEVMSHYGPSSPTPGQPGPYHSGSYGWNPQAGYQGQSQYPQPGGSPYMPVAQLGTLPLQPLKLGDYFASIFTTLRKSPGLFFGAALIFGSIVAIVAATGEFLINQSYGNALMDPYAQLDEVFSPATGIGVLISVLFSPIIMLVGLTFVWGMYAAMVARGATGMKTSLGQGFRFLSGHWGRLIGFALLMLVGVVILTILFALLSFLFLTVIFAGSDQPGIGTAFVGFLGVVLAGLMVAALGMYFYVRWNLAVPAIIIDDVGVFSGMRRSWRLTRGYFWRTLGITLLFGAIFSMVSFVIVMPLSTVSAFGLMAAGTEAQLTTGMLVTSMLVTAIGQLVNFIFSCMMLLAVLLFYFDYRFRKEGLGIQFQQLAAQLAQRMPTDRFDTSLEQANVSDTENDLIPGRHSFGPQSPGQPGPYAQPGPYR